MAKITPTYSIIIPHYNSHDTLIKCIDSIPDSNRFQIIVVDDCSNNCNVSDIPFNRRYPIQICKQGTCQGAGVARNEGLKKAKGEWILFADADDYFMPDLESALDKAVLKNKDIVYFNIDTEKNFSVQGKRYHKFVSGYDETKDKTINLKYRSWAPWAKIFRHSLITDNDLQFEPRRKGNDCFFVLNAALSAKDIAVIDTPVYHLTYSPDSLSHTDTKRWDYMFDVYDLWMWRYFFYKTNNIPLWQEYNICYLLKDIYKTFGLKKSFAFFIYSRKYHYSYKHFILNKLGVYK